MLNLQNRIKYDYNEMYDILYVVLAECNDSYGEEKDYGVVSYYDFNDTLVGVDIWDFKKKMLKGETIEIPVKINLKNIYKEIVNKQAG